MSETNANSVAIISSSSNNAKTSAIPKTSVSTTKPPVDKDGFQLVQKKRRQQANIVGSKQVRGNSAIKGAVRFADIYLGNCDLAVTPESIIEYVLSEMNIVVSKCEILMSRNDNSKSFKVATKFNDRIKLLSSDVWPEGVICRKFYNPRKL